MIGLFRQIRLEDKEMKLEQEARKEYRLSHPGEFQGEEDYVAKRLVELIEREGNEDDVSVNTGWRRIVALFRRNQNTLEDSEPVHYSIFKRKINLPLVGIPELKDVWQLAADAENYQNRYGRDMATLKLLDLSRNAADTSIRKQAKEALRYVS